MTGCRRDGQGRRQGHRRHARLRRPASRSSPSTRRRRAWSSMTPAKHRARIQSDIARIQAGGGTEIYSRARRRVPDAHGHARPPEARHPAHRRPGAAQRHPRSRAGHGRRGRSPVSGRPRQRRRRDAAPHDRRRRRRSPLQGRRSAVAAARLHARDRDGERATRPSRSTSSRKVVSPADFLRGIDMGSAPFLHGYVATKMKPPPAQQILAERGRPSRSSRAGTWASAGRSRGPAT